MDTSQTAVRSSTHLFSLACFGPHLRRIVKETMWRAWLTPVVHFISAKLV